MIAKYAVAISTHGDNMKMKSQQKQNLSPTLMNVFIICWVLLSAIQDASSTCTLDVTPVENKDMGCIDLDIKFLNTNTISVNNNSEILAYGQLILAEDNSETCKRIPPSTTFSFTQNLTEFRVSCSHMHPVHIHPLCNYTLNIPRLSCLANFSIPTCVGTTCDCTGIHSPVHNMSIIRVGDNKFDLEWHRDGDDALTEIVIENYINNTPRNQSIFIEDALQHSTIGALTVSIPDIPKQDPSVCFEFFFKEYCKQDQPICASAIPTLEDHTSNIIAVVVVFVLAIFIVLAYFIYYSLKKSRSFSPQDCPIPIGRMPTAVENVLYTTPLLIPMNDPMEICVSRLSFIKEIDAGTFGVVYQAILTERNGTCVPVAVKQLRSSFQEEREAFLEEMQTMQLIGNHPHVVKLIGYCKQQNPLAIVMELACESLKSYLGGLRETWNKESVFAMNNDFTIYPRNGGSDTTGYTQNSARHNSVSTQYTNVASEYPTTPTSDTFSFSNLVYVLDSKELQSFALQIAKGMAHLEAIPVTHRDVAARNILINEGKMLKISDFGMSRPGVYVNRRTRKIPLRWMAIEALETYCTDSRSDVWSYGIVLWEIGTLGATPYAELPDALVQSRLNQGHRLQRPKICTDELYALMLRCWNADPDRRPTFAEIVVELESKMTSAYVDFGNIDKDYVFPSAAEECLE